ncbi:helix-turn-helix domain-containing protein [Fodinicola acaciae]
MLGVILPSLRAVRAAAKAIRFARLAAICAALDCQPADLLTSEPARRTG